jgi:hypothetical protein
MPIKDFERPDRRRVTMPSRGLGVDITERPSPAGGALAHRRDAVCRAMSDTVRRENHGC